MVDGRLPGGGRFHYSDHLVALVAQAQQLTTRLDAVPAAAVAAAAMAARRRGAVLSARLDGSPLTDETAAQVDTDGVATTRALPPPRAARESGWAAALGVQGLPTQDVAAVEYANLLACGDAEPELAERILDEPLAVLIEVHALLCRGLVDPEVVGRPRRTQQALHDGAQGRVLYNTPDPAGVPGLLDELVGWLGEGSAGKPDLVVAGVVHERLLEWQPFEAANGRLARAVDRIVLRARGLEARGLAVREQVWIRDPLGYYGEVAATVRRRGDLSRWLQRWAEAHVESLQAVTETLGVRARGTPASISAEELNRLVPGTAVTVTEFASRTGTGRDRARIELRALVDAGVLKAEPGTHGLRFHRVSHKD